MTLTGVGRGALVASLLLVFPTDALAGQPAEQLKPEIDRVIRILEDPRLKGAARTKERRDALRVIAGPIFAWTRMAQRSLGRHWQRLTAAEREEFVQLFRDLIERTWVSVLERYSGEQIVYAGDSIQGDEATVRTRLLTKQGQPVSIDYRMVREGDRWRVADVLTEGVSLVLNYRTQFDQVIQTSSYRDLLQRIRSLEVSRRAS